MGQTAVCTVCGEKNPIELEFCRNCHASLEGTADQVKRQDAIPRPEVLADFASPNHVGDDEAPEWVRRITVQPSARGSTESAGRHENARDDQPGDEQGHASSIAGPAKSAQLPGWLSWPGAAEPDRNPSAAQNPDRASIADRIPGWLRDFGVPIAAATESIPQAAAADAPDRPHETEFAKELASEEGTSRDAGAASEAALTPDWSPAGDLAEPEASKAIQTFVPRSERELTKQATDCAARAFAPDGAAGFDEDPAFASTQVPDGLASTSSVDRSAIDDLVPPSDGRDLIEPAESSSWVQSLRPVESAIPEESAGAADLPPEERGPLAGLHGILPLIPGAGVPSGRPETQSAKLNVIGQQQAHAALIENILEAEVTPLPMKVAALRGARRGLRWAISALLLITLGAMVISGSQVLPLPSAVPNETAQAVRAIEDIPVGAPVLVIYDYEPATVGEMEASAGALIDHLLELKHPRLAVLSTSPTGAALADRFMSTAMAARAYQRGAPFVNMGYLPGGLTGVYDFAQNPVAVMPLGVDSTSVWASSILKGVTHLSDFAAIIVVTDSLEAGRVWIEQTEMGRGGSSMIMVSSAQAGPMLLPYVDAGQVKGLVAGLNGAAAAEQANGGLPGLVRKYWDAYCVGLYLSVILIAVGGLWNFWLGAQDRRGQQVG